MSRTSDVSPPACTLSFCVLFHETTGHLVQRAPCCLRDAPVFVNLILYSLNQFLFQPLAFILCWWDNSSNSHQAYKAFFYQYYWYFFFFFNYKLRSSRHIASRESSRKATVTFFLQLQFFSSFVFFMCIEHVFVCCVFDSKKKKCSYIYVLSLQSILHLSWPLKQGCL